MKNLTYLYYVVTVMLLFSCEQAIEVDDPINQIHTGQVFEDANTAYAALDQIYTELQTNSLFSGGSSGAGALLGTYTDDLDLFLPPGSSDNTYLFLNQLLPTNSIVKSVWANAYKEIYMANAVISGVRSSTGISTANRDRIEGEATVIRSMVYLNLMQIFGEIPYTVTTDYSVNQSLTKKPEAEILQLLASDLQAAVTLLSDDYRDPSRIYVNRKVAQMVLANVNLLNKNWVEAESLCRTIIQSPDYVFEADITKVFKKTGAHHLFLLKTLTDGTPVPETKIYYFTSPPPQNYVLSTDLATSFSAGDLRRLNWIKEVGNYPAVFYRNDKYKNVITNNDEYSVVYRLEQVYFMLAESLIKQNKTEEATAWINKTRVRAGLAELPLTLNQEQLLGELITEIRKEFFAEQGHRFYDLKRLGQLGVLKQHKPNWQDFNGRWPLPLSELLLNPNLAPQNPNY